MADEAVADTPVETPVAPVEQSSESLRAEMHADLAATSTPAPDASVTVSEGADPTQAAQPEWRGVRELLPELGLAADGYDDDHSALQGLAAQARRAAELEQQNRHFQYLLQQAQQPPAPATAPIQQVAPQPTVQPFLPKLPDFDERALAFLTRDENGNVVAKPGADPRLPQMYQEWTQAREQAVNKLVSDPQGYAEWVYQANQDRIQQEVSSKVSEALRAYHTESQARQYLTSNTNKIFQMGPNGQPLVEPTTGQQAFTPYGSALFNGLQVATQMGLPTYEARLAFAEQQAQTAELRQQMAMLQQQLAAGKVPTQAAAPAQQPTAQQRKDDFINKNRGQARKPNRNGTIAATRDGVDQNDRLSLREALRQDFAEAGFSVRN